MDRLLTSGILSSAFATLGIKTFQDACLFVKKLPYSRNSTKDDPLIVLKEGRGTCSSKHALIKRLADENSMFDCQLILCIFKMSMSNTPEIAKVLSSYKLEYIPEAHTYIKFGDRNLDLTFPESEDFSFLKDVLFEETISADQIREYKPRRHKSYLKNWVEEAQIRYSLEEIWAIREACIQAFSE